MNYRLPLVAALAAIAVPAAAQAQAQSAQAPQAMSKAELTAAVSARFAAIDENKDGFLSKDEIASVQAKVITQAQAARQERMEADFKKIDTNNNGSVSLDEFKAAAPPVRASDTPDALLAQLDGNKDGKVSAEEYRVRPLANFDKVDANNDGKITQQEVAAAAGNR